MLIMDPTVEIHGGGLVSPCIRNFQGGIHCQWVSGSTRANLIRNGCERCQGRRHSKPTHVITIIVF